MKTRPLLIAIAVSVLVAVAMAAPYDHIRSWTEAVDNGTIEGDPAYYYNGQATPDEYYHALITATNQIAADQWVPPNPQAVEFNRLGMVDPTMFCDDYMWEYRADPGGGYWPQAFADDYHRYDSITMFDDFYGPVTYLWPSPGRVYEHPAGGYSSMIVCWTDKA